MVDYNTYQNYVKYCIETNDFINFKNNPNYTYMLEHVNESEGMEYLKYILNSGITYNDIIEYSSINDNLGNPNKFNYEGILRISPTSLRYIHHANLIINHIKSLKLETIDIVEIGGGYGGLSIAIDFFSKKQNLNINSYSIIDLEHICKLQKIYISRVYPQLNINFIDSTTYGSDITKNNMFLISNYCFSEINNDHQQLYIKTLFPKISHGFFVWNNIPTYNFGFNFKEVDEYPSTSPSNKYVYF